MNAAITGATGFIGTYLSYYLLSNGYKVIALKRDTSSIEMSLKVFKHLNDLEGKSISFNDIEWVNGDLFDADSLDELTSKCDVCFHAAAMVSFNNKLADEMMKINVEGTTQVVNACVQNQVKKLVMISSVAALPNQNDKPVIDETFQTTTFFKFESAYGISKYRAEMEAWRAHGEGTDVYVVNPTVVLGAWRFKASSVQMFNAVDKGMPFYSKGTGSFVDARDVAQMTISLSENEANANKRFILCGGSLSYKDFLQQIAQLINAKKPSIGVGKNLSVFIATIWQLLGKITGKSAPLTPAMARAANRHFTYNTQKVQKATGLAFMPVDKTIKWTASFYNDQKA